MGTLKEMLPAPRVLERWGPGIMDMREFGHVGLKLPGELERLRSDYAKSPYSPTYMSMKSAVDSIRLTVDAAPPGVIFASNPHYGDYAKWNIALVKAGFKQIGTCAVNPVYSHEGWNWKGKTWYEKHSTPKPLDLPAYESQDGFKHWEHAFFFVKEGAPKQLAIDLKKRGQNGGDAANSLFQVNYAAIPGIKPRAPYGVYEPNYARLSRNCGCAMGGGAPKEDVHKYYFTVGVFPADKLPPKGWSEFLTLGGLRFAHNCAINPSAQPTCPHRLSEF